MLSVEDRIERTDDCWLWTGAVQSAGYGNTGQGLAHRVVYTETHGVIPEGLEVDHLCSNKLCVNPEHLEAVTPAENKRRARALRPPQSTFRCGHPFEENNWYVLTNGSWYCRVCQLVRCKRRNKS